MTTERRDIEDSAARTKPKRRRAGDRPEAVLEAAFGSPLPEAEAALWAAMSVEQRASAMQRLRVLLKFDGPGAEPAVETAAADAGLKSLNRWYEMHRAWRENRSIASLGTWAAQPRSRTLSHHNDLQRLVVGVVDADPAGSVRKLALALGEAFGAATGQAPKDWPSYNTLRKFAEAEQRRRAKEEEPGNDVQFDCCACELPHSDGVFVAFLVLDKGTRAVLGAALGDADDSRTGYARAARDALARLSRAPLQSLAWADRLERSEMVIGLDAAAWTGRADELKAAGLAKQLQPATAARRFGVYVRRLIGDRMGRVKFVPGRTAKDGSGATPTEDDLIRFGLEVDVYNAELLGRTGEAAGAEPPADLVSVLKLLAGR